MVNWKIGCSGFYYRHWKDVFYPEGLPQRKWFEFYCENFNTLELNVTFYRFPKLPFLQSWYERSPEQFFFAVKVPRAITHFKQFHNAAGMIADFYGLIREGLAGKLGCVLFQMPPRMSYTPERLERIVNNLDPSFNNVLEFRHLSWWNDEVYQVLSDKGIIFCGMSYPGLPADVINTTKILYYRFHGITELYKSRYKKSELTEFVKTVGHSKNIKEAYIYFNNDIGASAIINGREMQALVQ